MELYWRFFQDSISLLPTSSSIPTPKSLFQGCRTWAMRMLSMIAGVHFLCVFCQLNIQFMYWKKFRGKTKKRQGNCELRRHQDLSSQYKCHSLKHHNIHYFCAQRYKIYICGIFSVADCRSHCNSYVPFPACRPFHHNSAVGFQRLYLQQGYCQPHCQNQPDFQEDDIGWYDLEMWHKEQ